MDEDPTFRRHHKHQDSAESGEGLVNLPSLMFALLHDADDLVLACNATLQLTYVNPSLERAARLTAQQMLGRSVVDAGVFGASAVRLESALRKALADGSSDPLELEWADGGLTHTYLVRIVAEADRSRVLALARDASEQRRIERDLQMREVDFRTLAENSPDVIIRYGLDGRAIYCNREIKDRVVITNVPVVGSRPSESAPPGMLGVQPYEDQLARTLQSGEQGSVELHVPHPNGEMRIHSVKFAAEHDASGAICGAIAVGRDVTDFVRIQQALVAKEREFRSLAENAGDNIARWDPDTRIRFANPAMASLIGRPLEEIVGLTPTEAVGSGGNGCAQIEEAIRRVARDCRDEMVELHFASPVTKAPHVHQIRLVPERDESGAVRSVLGIGRDITEKIEHLELIESLIRTDPLTRLANRQALQERIAALFAAALRRHLSVALMLLDVDQFKAINDSLGHGAGDELLCQMAKRLARCLRPNDLLVRLGGDEFVVVIPDVDDSQAVGAVAARLHDALAQPMPLAHRQVRMTFSIGVALYPRDGDALESLLANADAAMYHAKRNGRARTEYYRAELGDAVRRRLMLEQSMRGACDGAELELHYQPLVRLDDPLRVIGAEALLRWRHPALGLLAPGAFIALAEETDLILPIGRWVIRHAAEAAARWNRGRAQPLHVSINVSTRQFNDDGLLTQIDEALERSACKPNWLWIEITESALLEGSAKVRAALEALRARGLRVAIDDFGTGYSGLSYLAQFPIDLLKIDKSFVQGIGRGTRGEELVKAFIAMASALNISTVAEGVETAEQASFLAAHGCSLAQGWRFGRPVPEPELRLDDPPAPPPG